MSPGGPLTGKSVLVAEDQYLLADDLACFFEDLGASLFGPYASAAAANVAIADRTPDYAVLDIALAGNNVFPLAENLRARGVPCIFLTGFQGDAIPAAFADIPVLTKPYSEASLLAVLRRLGWIIA